MSSPPGPSGEDRVDSLIHAAVGEIGAERFDELLDAALDEVGSRGREHGGNPDSSQGAVRSIGRRDDPPTARRGGATSLRWLAAAAAVVLLAGVSVAVFGRESGVPVTVGGDADRQGLRGDSAGSLATVVSEVEVPSPFDVAATPSAVWVLSADGSVRRIDPGTNRVVASIDIGRRPSPDSSIVADGDAVWVSTGTVDDYPSVLVRIDPVSNAVAATVPVGWSANEVVVVQDDVWVANDKERTVLRIDSGTNQVVATVEVGSWVSPIALASDASVVWVARNVESGAATQLSRIDPETNSIADVAALPDEGIVMLRSIVSNERGVFVLSSGLGPMRLHQFNPRTGEVDSVDLEGAGFDLAGNLVGTDEVLWVLGARTVGDRAGRAELIRVLPAVGAEAFSGVVDVAPVEIPASSPAESAVVGVRSSLVGSTLWVADGINTVLRLSVNDSPTAGAATSPTTMSPSNAAPVLPPATFEFDVPINAYTVITPSGDKQLSAGWSDPDGTAQWLCLEFTPLSRDLTLDGADCEGSGLSVAATTVGIRTIRVRAKECSPDCGAPFSTGERAIRLNFFQP